MANRAHVISEAIFNDAASLKNYCDVFSSAMVQFFFVE